MDKDLGLDSIILELDLDTVALTIVGLRSSVSKTPMGLRSLS